MMAFAFLLLCLVVFVGSFISRATAKEEPLCTSRFDFESRLLERMLVVEFEVSQVKTKVASTLQELEGFAQKIKDEQAAKIKDMTTLGMKLTEDVGELTNTFTETRANLERDFVSLYKDVENKTDAKVQKIQVSDEAVKPAVAFLAHTVSDDSPGSNTLLRFTQTVTNTNDVYSTATGFFTAPVNGTYIFAVQMCQHSGKYIHIQIYAELTLIASSVIYDHAGNGACSTVNAVAILSAGNKVHVKSGHASHSGDIIYQSSYRWASFSGVLVH